MTTNFERKQLNLLIGLFLSLMTLTASGVGWLIVQNAYRLNKHDDQIESLQKQMNDLRNISSNLIEAYNNKVEKDKIQDSAIEKQRDEILELWKCSKRGGSTSQVLNKN